MTTPSPSEEMVQSIEVPPDLHERYVELCERWPKHRVEIINGRLVVKKFATYDHNRIVSRLLRQIMPRMIEAEWDVLPDITLFLAPHADRYRPDLTVVGPNPRLWGQDHVYGYDTRLVVEVVSDSSRQDDDLHKPPGYTEGRVPLLFVIDTLASQAILYSGPTAKGYTHRASVTLGAKLDLPDPWNVTIDTGALTG